MVVIGDGGVDDLRLAGAGVVQELLELMAADVGEDAARLFARPEPIGPAGRRAAVRPETDHLHHAADGAALDELPGAHGALHVQPLGVVDHVFPAGLGDLAPRGLELLEGGEGRLVGEVILARIHHAEAERAALVRHGGGGDELDLALLEHGLERAGAAWPAGRSCRISPPSPDRDRTRNGGRRRLRRGHCTGRRCGRDRAPPPRKGRRPWKPRGVGFPCGA